MRLLHTSRSRFHRAAFTLVELVVVLTIIAILVSLSAAGVIRFITAQQISNTRTTINKVYDRLNTSYKAYRNKFFKDPIPQGAHDWIMNNMANPADPNFEARIRVIWVKMQYLKAFPVNFNEALDPWPWMVANQGAPAYRAYLAKLGVTGSTGAAYESSACLLMALSQAQGGGGVNAEDLAGGQSVASFTLPSGQTIPAFVDAWGNPLTFSRWPTGSTVLNPNGPQIGYNDPGDPNGYLAGFAKTPAPTNIPGWLTTTYAQNYRNYLHNLPTTPDIIFDPLSYYLIPMIVSNGPDKKLGLNVYNPTKPPSLITPPLNIPPSTTLTDDGTHAADDNIYSTTAP